MFSALSKRAKFSRVSAFLNSKRDYCIKSIHVSGLPYNTTENDIRGLFSQYGKIHGVYLPKKNVHRIKGYGFVRYIVGEIPKGVDHKQNVPTSEEIEECTKIAEKAALGVDRTKYKERTLIVEVCRNQDYHITSNS